MYIGSMEVAFFGIYIIVGSGELLAVSSLCYLAVFESFFFVISLRNFS